MKHFGKLNKKHRYWLDFLWVVTQREIKSKYKRVNLGFLWILINPLLQMLVMGFVFQFFIPVHVDNYFLFLFASLLPWNFFSSSLLQATPAIVDERDLIKKTSKHREIIVLSIVLSNMFHLLVSLLLLLVYLSISKLLAIGFSFELVEYVFGFLKLIPFLIWLLLLAVSFSLFFSALNVKMRDLSFIIRSLVPLWFYATPIAYSLDLLPKIAKNIVSINPVTPIIEGFHSVLVLPSSMPKILFIIHFLLMIVWLLVAIAFFNKESKDFADFV